MLKVGVCGFRLSSTIVWFIRQQAGVQLVWCAEPGADRDFALREVTDDPPHVIVAEENWPLLPELTELIQQGPLEIRVVLGQPEDVQRAFEEALG